MSDAELPPDLSVDDMLRLRHQLAAQHDIAMLDTLDEQLRHLAARNAPQAEQLFTALAASPDEVDREAAALNIGHLLPIRPESAKVVLRTLLRDDNTDIRMKATDTLNTAIHEHVISADEAARLLT